MGLIDNVRKSLFPTPDEALAEALWEGPPADMSERERFREDVALRVKKALALGADPNQTLVFDKFGQEGTCSPLGRAIHLDDVYLVEALLDAGAELEAVGQNYGGPWDEVKSTALGVAILRDRTAIVGTLLARGASTAAVDESGGSALCFAARCFDPVRYKGQVFPKWTVNALIAGGADLDAVDSEGDSPLHIAARGGNYGLVKELVEAGADLEARDKLGRTPLMALSASLLGGYPEPGGDRMPPVPAWEIAGSFCIQALLAGGADAKAVDSEGRCALRLMERAPTASWIKALVEAGADPDALAADGLSPLSAAVSRGGEPNGDERIVKYEKELDAGRAEMLRASRLVGSVLATGESAFETLPTSGRAEEGLASVGERLVQRNVLRAELDQQIRGAFDASSLAKPGF